MSAEWCSYKDRILSALRFPYVEEKGRICGFLSMPRLSAFFCFLLSICSLKTLCDRCGRMSFLCSSCILLNPFTWKACRCPKQVPLRKTGSPDIFQGGLDAGIPNAMLVGISSCLPRLPAPPSVFLYKNKEKIYIWGVGVWKHCLFFCGEVWSPFFVCVLFPWGV